jgi:hypothetical protein
MDSTSSTETARGAERKSSRSRSATGGCRRTASLNLR